MARLLAVLSILIVPVLYAVFIVGSALATHAAADLLLVGP